EVRHKNNALNNNFVDVWKQFVVVVLFSLKKPQEN
ncbi:MAG: hypothetical protein ACI9LS_001860, partial [Flavobacteriales bacterium]